MSLCKTIGLRYIISAWTLWFRVHLRTYPQSRCTVFDTGAEKSTQCLSYRTGDKKILINKLPMKKIQWVIKKRKKKKEHLQLINCIPRISLLNGLIQAINAVTISLQYITRLLKCTIFSLYKCQTRTNTLNIITQ